MFWHICSPTTPQTFPPWLRFAMVLGPRIRIGSVRGSKIMFLGAISKWGTPPLVRWKADGPSQIYCTIGGSICTMAGWKCARPANYCLQDNPPVYKAQFVLQYLVFWLAIGCAPCSIPRSQPHWNCAWHLWTYSSKSMYSTQKQSWGKQSMSVGRLQGRATTMFEK